MYLSQPSKKKTSGTQWTCAILCAALLLMSCHKEAKPTPSKLGNLYTLPQGNHSYDDSITAFFQQYGSYILYNYTYKDFAYQTTSYLPDTAYAANPAYIGASLGFLYNQCFNFYPSSFLQQTMPFRIFLASRIDSIRAINNQTYGRTAEGIVSGNSMLGIGWADSTLAQQSPSQLKQLRGWLNAAYWNQALGASKISVPDSFLLTSPDYTQVNSGNMYAKGVVLINSNPMNVTSDFVGYITVITSNTKANLDTTIFAPSTDVNGLCKKRYNIVVNWAFQNLQEDLQAIGDAP